MLQLVFGAGESDKQHACAGKHTAITVLLALLIRLVEVCTMSCLPPSLNATSLARKHHVLPQCAVSDFESQSGISLRCMLPIACGVCSAELDMGAGGQDGCSKCQATHALQPLPRQGHGHEE